MDGVAHTSDETAQTQADQTLLPEAHRVAFDSRDDELAEDAFQRRVVLEGLSQPFSVHGTNSLTRIQDTHSVDTLKHADTQRETPQINLVHP